MRESVRFTAGEAAGQFPPPPYPAGEGARRSTGAAGQPRVPTGPGARARDCTAPPEASGPRAPRGRGRRAQSKVSAINCAASPREALRESLHALTSVVTQAIRLDPAAGAAWAWTVIYLVDGLNVLIESATEPHPWFTDSAHWRLNPGGWAPPPALAKVAARVAGRPKNGETQ